jgi:hypothetical protein
MHLLYYRPIKLVHKLLVWLLNCQETPHSTEMGTYKSLPPDRQQPRSTSRMLHQSFQLATTAQLTYADSRQAGNTTTVKQRLHLQALCNSATAQYNNNADNPNVLEQFITHVPTELRI